MAEYSQSPTGRYLACGLPEDISFILSHSGLRIQDSELFIFRGGLGEL